MLFKAHSLQKISPWEHDTGVLAGKRHNLHDANGRNESLDSLALVEFQADFANDRSCDVKTALEVFRLPESRLDIESCVWKGKLTVGHSEEWWRAV
jgi:hypothetical protein